MIVPFVLFGLALLSLWVRKEVKIWGTFLGLSLVASTATGIISVPGACILFAWAVLWNFYLEQQKKPVWFLMMAILLVTSFIFKMHLIPGFQAYSITPKFRIGLDIPIMEFMPLALIVPLASNRKDWGIIFSKGVPFSIVGVAILAILGVASGAVHWQYKLPSYAAARYLTNFFLVATLEEGFYRGFVQSELCRLFSRMKRGNLWALLLASLIFTLAHLYWSPNIGILAFVFLASLLYGGVYLYTGKIESAIFCHFLLNFIHMTFFSYHAM